MTKSVVLLFLEEFKEYRNVITFLVSCSSRALLEELEFWADLHCMAQCYLNLGKSNVKGFEMLPIVRAGFKLLLRETPLK